MERSNLEQLEKVLELLKAADGLQDATIRTQMQQLILNSTTEGQPLVVPTVPWGAPDPTRSDRKPILRPPMAGTQQYKVYKAVAVRASADRPVSSAEIEQDVASLDVAVIPKVLSQLWYTGRLARRQVDDVARDGYSRALYKYWVPDKNGTPS